MIRMKVVVKDEFFEGLRMKVVLKNESGFLKDESGIEPEKANNEASLKALTQCSV